jgi:hypothetical protein
VLAGYGDGGANGGSGGGGNIALAYSATGAIVVPDSDHNQENEASCSSIEAVRLNHALQDVNAFVSGMTIWRRIALADQRMHVSYTDGSTEEWVYSGSTGDAALVPFPVQGTLKCE